MLYTLNLYSDLCQIILNKPGGKDWKTNTKQEKLKKKNRTPPNFPLAASHKKMYKTQSEKNQNIKVQGEGGSLKMTGSLLTKK